MITSERAIFVASHVRKPVKDALRLYAAQDKISMSAFVAAAIEEKLRALGVEIIEDPVNTGEPLPFEEEPGVASDASRAS